jgi:hypothetical protein
MTWSAVACVHFAVVCAAIGIVITASESLWHWSQGHYDVDGVWPWKIAREAYSERTAAVLTPLMTREATLVLFSLRLTCAIALPLLYSQGYLATVPLSALLAIHCMTQLRSRWGGEGSDQMTTLVLVSGLASDLFPALPLVATSAALFLGAQITLSYIASGGAKLFGPLWRNGQALPRIMNHYTYGHARFARILASRPSVAKTMCRSVILFQITFWVFYLLPMPFALIYPLGGVFFHANIAFFMRLNLFIPAFIGTYPCLLFTYHFVRPLVT